MRVAFATRTDRRAGGVETYIETVLPELARIGHDVALWHQTSEPVGRERIALPLKTETAKLDAPSQAEALARTWQADVVFVQGLDGVELEAALLRLPGSAFVAHNYAGTCISGTRAWSLPVVRPCPRQLGPLCLAHYLPHGCGGRSAVTMLRLYRRETSRQDMLRTSAIVTLSSHMRQVFLQHGFDHQRVTHVPYGTSVPTVARPSARSEDGAVRLLAVGRLERLKGIHLLIDALPAVQKACERDVHLLVVGDGGARESLRRQAARRVGGNPRIAVSFVGWCSPEERDRHMRDSDVLVVPSAWPEPLGLSGIEAVRLGLPVVAFDVGGVREWLVDGVHGRLVQGDPPTAAALSRALSEWLTVGDRRGGRPAEDRPVDLPTPATHARGLIDVAQRLRARMSP